MLIDLKNCLIYIGDGTTMDGQVNNVSGYMPGVTSITVDTFTGVVPTGAAIIINNVPGYFVTSTAETMGHTTTINFQPPLLQAISDNNTVNVEGNFIRMKIGEGNITWNETKNREFKLDRGIIDQVRNADQVPMDVSFEIMFEELTAANPMTDPPTAEDVLKNRGAAAGWISADQVNECAPYCVNVRIINTPPNCPTVAKEMYTFQNFYYEKLDHDPKAGTVKTTGKCNAQEATVVRIPQE